MKKPPEIVLDLENGLQVLIAPAVDGGLIAHVMRHGVSRSKKEVKTLRELQAFLWPFSDTSSTEVATWFDSL